MAYARGSVDTVNFRRLEAMRPGHGFVRDFAVHHVDVADERRLFLAGRRARIHELRPGLLVLGVGMTRARDDNHLAIYPAVTNEADQVDGVHQMRRPGTGFGQCGLGREC